MEHVQPPRQADTAPDVPVTHEPTAGLPRRKRQAYSTGWTTEGASPEPACALHRRPGAGFAPSNTAMLRPQHTGLPGAWPRELWNEGSGTCFCQYKRWPPMGGLSQ